MAAIASNETSGTRALAGRVVLFFGIISPRKGLMSLIDAFPKIRQRVDDAFLMIVGQPFEDIRPYQDRIQALGLAAVSQLRPGYVALCDVPQVFEQAAVVVLPYLDSSQSGVVLSAYAFAKPVVASDVGGIGELVEDGVTGFLCPPGQADILADRVITILQDDELRAAMGKRARALVRSRHSWEHIGGQTASVYGQVLRGANPQTGAGP
jgi:glycosyltransferase involved in cell wall biosynthesis